ncbi:splicing factor 3B subunit, putative [Perkinsus marinus ATCC 50983]|uniref:Splicing factor 3B subunit, putative n=1 Tax=Perkinsus marinus (strain ATCC 50983 / TXsc) TaxID=423536 RepID=C5KRA2_PERM5|nr:splicing factor 3B subunit, putative [Perkinsus marinus ATCC 50983]EER13003.1 splicing factor 3B subunit, putative [Perkinsus marinus ATCC 50983]|eukprot:XP_002781208.1 splicing factor 3B subunit, putative [Perkinsus marinus ATCC 50983]
MPPTKPDKRVDDDLEGEDELTQQERQKGVYQRQGTYREKALHRVLSPQRADPFSSATPAADLTTYSDVAQQATLQKERAEVLRQIQTQKKEGENGVGVKRKDEGKDEDSKKEEVKKRRSGRIAAGFTDNRGRPAAGFDIKEADDRWETPVAGSGEWGETPAVGAFGGAEPTMKKKRTVSLVGVSRFSDAPSETPYGAGGETPDGSGSMGETPVTRSRWDDAVGRTPGMGGATPGATPLVAATPGTTPLFQPGMETPMGLTPQFQAAGYGMTRLDRELDVRNKYMTDDEIDALLPLTGYEIVKPPEGYEAQQQAHRISVNQAATPLGETTGFSMPSGGATPAMMAGLDASTAGLSDAGTGLVHPKYGGAGDLPDLRPEDVQHFSALIQGGETDDNLSPEEAKERKVMALLLKVKNGTPQMRKMAMREITERAKQFGPDALFNQILPLLMSTTLEDQERHLLVKVIDRVLHKLDDMVRPYVHKILVVIEPLLIDEDYFARVEGREIISNLSKAAGLATMIATMRPDIDHPDEYVRNTTARAFAVVASALGVPQIMLFLKAVCQSKKSWQARHTGIKIVQQIALLMGCGVLSYLKQLVDIVQFGLGDEQQKVRTITALALAALAEAAFPYGIECFDSVLRPLWRGICEHRGKGLAAFLKAIGYIIPLMDAEHANYYTREVMIILVREFSTPDEEMKKIVLKVVKQCVATEGVEAAYVREDILPPFFRNFWVVRMAADRRNYKQLVDTTVELARKVGGAEIVQRIAEDLKDNNEAYRRMVMETIEKVVDEMGVQDVDSRLEEQIVDGMLYAFQEQSSDDTETMLNGFGTIVNCLGVRIKPYLPQIAGIIRWRLNTPSARVRQQAADLIARIAGVMKLCGEEQMLGHFGLFLYEYLGEEYPEVLGSILGALKAIVNVIGMTKMAPPIKDLLPRLTPILKNRHEKVEENCIDLIGRIADRGADLAPPREWNRICFDLLELLKAQKKGIRRAAVNTFGYIAKAIGPHDVIATLLNNLKVQERQLRVCTTVAIGIVAETCGPFTVLPAIMNEYKVPELHVQNGILKSLSFMFEYIGEMGKDYVHAVTPLFEDALIDRDLVHRQTATWAVKHMALGVHALGQEECLEHLMNYIFPNIFETAPHMIQAFFDAMDAMRVSIGPCRVLQYVVQGLWHPARRVRECYWRVYNSLYIGAEDALVAFYPRVPLTWDGQDEEQDHPEVPKLGPYNNRYWRTEMDLII